jgi:hypothetical protein
MQVTKFLIFLLLSATFVESARILRKSRTRKAKRQERPLTNQTAVNTEPPPSDAIVVVENVTNEVQDTSPKTVLQKEIQSLIETLKTARGTQNDTSRDARKNSIKKPRSSEVEPKHIDLECKFGNASD